MFIIKEDDILKEFYSTSWEKNYNRYTAILEEAAAEMHGFFPADPKNLITDADSDFTTSFAYTMNDGLRFARENAADLNGYLKIRNMLANSKSTPEDFDYAIFGNIETGMLDNTDIDKNIDMIKTYGYVPRIVKIVSNEPHTVIYFNDGTKTVVKCADSEEFDIEKGVYFALLKKAYGSRNLQHIFKLISAAIGDNTSSDTSAINSDDLVPDDMESVNIDDWDTDRTAE